MSSKQAIQPAQLDQWLKSLHQVFEEPNTPAWVRAHEHGAIAIKPLAELMKSTEQEIARNGKRAMWEIVRHSSAPGRDDERGAVERELVDLLKFEQPTLCREFIWMLSEIGGERAAVALGACLRDVTLREDARCALGRIPMRKVTTVLQEAYAAAPDEFKDALAESLKQRGKHIPGHRSKKPVPEK